MSTTAESLALHGGEPVRATLLPYGAPSVDAEDCAAVVEVLRSDWLTTGPAVGEFETAFARAVGADEAVAVSSGTAALHAAMFALDVGPGDEVIVPTLTFAASANCVAYQGGTPVLVDVDPDTLLVSPAAVEARITPRTKGVVGVDYAGQPCDWSALRALADRHGLWLVADGCHALGGLDHGRPVGTLADITAFSLHPVKHVTTGEGGVATTDAASLADRMRLFRNHGIGTDHRQRERAGTWAYDMVALGYNYRLTDIQCALGRSQLRKLGPWLVRRRAIAQRYAEAFERHDELRPLALRDGVTHAYHLYVVALVPERLTADRATVFRALRAEGIGVNVHYVPVHLHPYYRDRYGTRPGTLPVAESAYERILSLPMFPRMTDGDVADVIAAVGKVVAAFRRPAWNGWSPAAHGAALDAAVPESPARG